MSRRKSAEFGDPSGAALDRLLLIDTETLRIPMASGAARALLGYPTNESGPLDLCEVVPNVAPAAWRRLTRRMAARGAGTSEFGTRLRRCDGGEVDALLRLHPISRDDRPIVCASIQTAPTGNGARLLDAALLRSVIDTAPDAIITIDPQGRIGDFSRPPSACSATLPPKRVAAT
jgi:PAS domain-containing protein